MDYAEASYFDGYAFQHIAAYYEERRIKRLAWQARRAFACHERGRRWRNR